MKNYLKIGITSLLIYILALPVLANSDYEVSDDPNTINLLVYPIPVTGSEFTVSANAVITEVSILNILGQKVFEQQSIGETKINIELEIKEKGVYLLQVKTFDGRVTTKRILFK